MVRQTSITAYNQIKEEGLLSERRWQVYDTLFNHGPCTANELAKHFEKMNFLLPGNVNLNIVTRLGELRNMGVVSELKERPCRVTGMTVIEWDVTDRLPIKLEQPKKIKCKTCNGRGYIMEQQLKLF
jgi:hypothetical protein